MMSIILRWLLCLALLLLSVGALNTIGREPGTQLATAIIFCGATLFAGSAAQSYVKIIVDGQGA